MEIIKVSKHTTRQINTENPGLEVPWTLITQRDFVSNNEYSKFRIIFFLLFLDLYLILERNTLKIFLLANNLQIP